MPETTEVYSVRMTSGERRMIQECSVMNGSVSESEFVRAALREHCESKFGRVRVLEIINKQDVAQVLRSDTGTGKEETVQ